MKWLGVVICYVGGWMLVTLYVAGFASSYDTPYWRTLIAVAPYTAIAAVGVALIMIGLVTLERKNDSNHPS